MLCFLGTGLIGGTMAEAALERGEKVQVWNRNAARTTRLVELGAKAFETPGEAASGAARVHLALTADAAVDAVLEQLGDTAAIIVDHSTTSAEGTHARAQRLAERSQRFLHAPVFMSPQACLQSKGVMVVGGAAADVEAARGGLEAMTGRLWCVGEEPRLAAQTKLLGNAMILAMVGGFADVLQLSRGMGVSAEHVTALFEQLDVSMVLAGRGRWMAEGDFEPRWTLRMARKDLGLMLQSAQDAPLLEQLGAVMDAQINNGDGERDVGVLSKEKS